MTLCNGKTLPVLASILEDGEELIVQNPGWKH